VYLVQREVAERLASGPGSKEYGALSVNVQAIAMAEVLFRVPPGAFQPPPKVESAVVRITPRDDPLVAPEEEAEFQTLVQGIFGMRRKQMRRVLRSLRNVNAEAADALLARCQIAPDARPETLPPARFAALLRALRG
jgi:16S rRNA (adenine1518-N6/adenine1519-N6)-dimethyltransferase